MERKNHPKIEQELLKTTEQKLQPTKEESDKVVTIIQNEISFISDYLNELKKLKSANLLNRLKEYKRDCKEIIKSIENVTSTFGNSEAYIYEIVPVYYNHYLNFIDCFENNKDNPISQEALNQLYINLKTLEAFKEKMEIFTFVSASSLIASIYQ